MCCKTTYSKTYKNDEERRNKEFVRLNELFSQPFGTASQVRTGTALGQIHPIRLTAAGACLIPSGVKIGSRSARTGEAEAHPQVRRPLPVLTATRIDRPGTIGVSSRVGRFAVMNTASPLSDMPPSRQGRWLGLRQGKRDTSPYLGPASIEVDCLHTRVALRDIRSCPKYVLSADDHLNSERVPEVRGNQPAPPRPPRSLLQVFRSDVSPRTSSIWQTRRQRSGGGSRPPAGFLLLSDG